MKPSSDAHATRTHATGLSGVGAAEPSETIALMPEPRPTIVCRHVQPDISQTRTSPSSPPLSSTGEPSGGPAGGK